MARVMRFFRWIWQKITFWIFFWKHKAKPIVSECPDSKKSMLKLEKTPNVVETLELIEPSKESKTFNTDESLQVADPCGTLAKTTGGAEVELGHGGWSLLQLPWLAIKSVSLLMISSLQSGWQMCSGKSSVSSTSLSSQMRTRSPLESPEPEMLWQVYLVLWAIRKQLRQLAHRQERRRRRRRHTQAHTGLRPAHFHA
ncbi:sperm acrosome developmental regulator [Manis javanica]|uniref:sperm acrosome developmental regulator n=1 Tax=Manis javanica TaxID=9974 RepID=UPI0018792BB9|nr:uncharacterized protein C7orf61 homolog isoform X2 [Manis javanica]KAI5945525.1 hypothetical protein MM560_G52n68 [Manis javanica]